MKLALTDLQLDILRVLRAAPHPLACNEIARLCGYHTGQDAGRHSHNGRAMAPAQRVIFPITDLRKRNLAGMTTRRDGLSGTAYVITEQGRYQLKERAL